MVHQTPSIMLVFLFARNCTRNNHKRFKPIYLFSTALEIKKKIRRKKRQLALMGQIWPRSRASTGFPAHHGPAPRERARQRPKSADSKVTVDLAINVPDPTQHACTQGVRHYAKHPESRVFAHLGLACVHGGV